ncbi:unnamed protein product [Effrenium voratum]|nr:unnamed protein product [Effrenium voratum]
MGKLKGFLESQSHSFEVLDQVHGRINVRLKKSPGPPSALGEAFVGNDVPNAVPKALAAGLYAPLLSQHAVALASTATPFPANPLESHTPLCLANLLVDDSPACLHRPKPPSHSQYCALPASGHILHAPQRADVSPACKGPTPAANPSTAPISLKSLNLTPAMGTVLCVNPAEIRWTHCRVQRLFTCGRSLLDVADQLRTGKLLPSVLPTINIVHYDRKWYSRNNRRLWCFKSAKVPAVQAVVSPVDQHFLKGLNTTTDGLTTAFWPPCLCSACGQEFPSLKGREMHFCAKTYNTSAIDWDDNASEASSDTSSEEGAYGEDGFWYSQEEWDEFFERDAAWSKDSLSRSPLWRAAAAGNKRLLENLLWQGVAVDDVDADGVSPLLASVRRGKWRVAEMLLWAGAFQQPWKWTKRKGDSAQVW